MHAFSHALIHAELHTIRTAEAAAWRLAREAAPAGTGPGPALRDRLGEALIAAGIRLMRPAHLHRRITRPYGGIA
ncbi:hypothetical protein J7E97_00900 [Streptomyces sp. ISL-66]|uniref:hypothetical protein n=1 Tax=Streptomyces sp. ISL-66 TaxID=2819186 RepID=UPI001BEAE2CB|nr:hypothetical protein [Streptomyces sp. ISL-66]MBT2466458.1 hypothetical protein [Streptomyces sp. ISL-66]